MKHFNYKDKRIIKSFVAKPLPESPAPPYKANRNIDRNIEKFSFHFLPSVP